MWHAAHPLSGFDPRCLRYIHLSDGQKVVSKTANEGSIPSGCAPLFSLLTGTNRVGDARLSVTSFEKGISGSRTQNSLRCVLTIPSGFPRKRKQISKGFLPAGNPGSPVYDLYMIHIAPYGDSSKIFGKFFKVSDIPLPAQYLRRHQSPPCACCEIQAIFLYSLHASYPF